MKKFNLYKQEKADGLAELLMAGVRASGLCPIKPVEPFPAQLAVVTAQNLGQEDLYYLTTVLASSGWNLNDDVFLPREIWAARATPEDKPLNYEHTTDDVIGHMTEAIVIADDNSRIPDDVAVEDLPAKLHIVSSAVLYRFLGTEEPAKRMQKIISEVAAGKWFVSMECLMASFDYALQDKETGESQIIARNEATAFLTKHLRAYGGTGEYQGKKVGRVLKDFIFSGKGLVAQPANPESVILSSHAKNFSAVYHNFNEKTFGDNKKMEELNKTIAGLEAQLKVKADEASALQVKLETVEKTVTTLTEEKEKLATDLAANAGKLAEATASLAKAEAEKVEAQRVNTVIDKLGYSKEEAAAWVSDLSALNETAFANMVEKISLKVVKPPKESSLPTPPGEHGKPIKTVNLAAVAEKIENAQAGEATLSIPVEPTNELMKDLSNYFGDK
jgi:hypothetical protein